MRKIIKRYICVIAILSSIMGYAQCVKDSPGYNSCLLLQAKKALELAEEEAAKSKAREAIAVAENLISVGLIQIDTKAQIQTLELKIIQADLEKSQAAKYEQDQARKALAQAQEMLDKAIRELNMALDIAAANTLIPNLGATYEAQRSAAEYTAQAVQHSQLAVKQYGYATGQTTTPTSNPSEPTWYMDYDGDGWHSISQQKNRPPGAFGWKSTTKGIDCNDKDSTKTYNCSDDLPTITWFLDMDGDGYFAAGQMATTSPGAGWVANTTKGPDCNDNLFSADNSVCSVATPTPCTNKTVCSAGYSLVNCECVQDPLPDPCDEIKKALADAKFKEMLVNLKDSKKLDLNNETGTFQAKDGNYYPMEVFEGQPGVFVPSGSGPAQNTNHVHMKKWIDADGVVKRVFPMPSPTDIATIYTDYHFVRSMGTDPGNNYAGTINSLGYFQLRYTGQADNLSWDQLKAKRDLIDTYENGEIFKALAKEHGNMIGFLIFIRDTLKITDIALYQVDDTGAKKIELDANNQIKEIPCK